MQWYDCCIIKKAWQATEHKRSRKFELQMTIRVRVDFGVLKKNTQLTFFKTCECLRGQENGTANIGCKDHYSFVVSPSSGTSLLISCMKWLLCLCTELYVSLCRHY